MLYKKLTSALVLALTVTFSSFTFAGFSQATTAAELQDEACPTSWKDLKTTLPGIGANPSFTGTPPWANAIDRSTFETYLRSFVITKTLANTTPTVLSGDKLTVASQCIMRRNAMVDAYFGRNTNSGMPARVSLEAILLIINQYMDEE